MAELLEFKTPARTRPDAARQNMPRLRELRGKLSRSALGAAIGVEATTVKGWEDGTEAIPDDRKAQLAEYFGVSVAFLMHWEDDPARQMSVAERETEAAVLSELVDVMWDWSSRLPLDSEWRWAFLGIRHVMGGPPGLREA